LNVFLLDAPFGTEAEGTIQSGFIRRDRRPPPRDQLSLFKFDTPLVDFGWPFFTCLHQKAPAFVSGTVDYGMARPSDDVEYDVRY
jgi:hypothetical protein